MKKKHKKSILIAITVLVLAAAVICAEIFHIQNNNDEKIFNTIDDSYTNENYSQEEIIDMLEECTELKIAGRYAKIELYGTLSMAYSIEKDYTKVIQYAVQSIFLADQKEESFGYSAWNYINLASTFMDMYSYDSAEELIETALDYKIQDENEDRWIKETAYIYMAELKTRQGKMDEAEKYLNLSYDYITEDSYDNEEMLIKRKLIYAAILCARGDYEKAEAEIQEYYDLDMPDSFLEINVGLPMRAMKARFVAMNGDIDEAVELCDAVIADQKRLQFAAERLSFLNEVVRIFERRDVKEVAKYREQLYEAYDDMIAQSGDVTSEYVFTAYANLYKENYEKNQYVLTVIIALSVTVFVCLLLFLLRKSRKQVIRDALTGVYNRYYFDKTYKKLALKKEKLAMVMFDIDYFKKINDTHGHDFGDLVLIEVARIINAKKIKGAKVFRMGGEEFCVLCSGRTLEEAVTCAERIRLSVEKSSWDDGVSVTVSGGVAFAEPGENLYKLADMQLYHSKENGRNQISYMAEVTETDAADSDDK
ncbi:MAG: diguanylate cyclase [Anaerovoracaceae bacterium]